MSPNNLPISLEDAAVKDIPDHAYYIPNFITAEEEETLLHQIHSRSAREWTTLSHRRLQTWPSSLVNNALLDAPLPPWLREPAISRLLALPLSTSGSSLITSETASLPSNQPAMPTHIFSTSPHGAANHVLINEYLPGQGIMPHEDGPAYHPVVATVSLGASIVLDIYEKPSQTVSISLKPSFRILQEPRSLLITTGALYTDYLHGIARHTVDEDLNGSGISNWSMLGEKQGWEDGKRAREPRVSLTFRDVKRVVKAGRLIPGLTGGRR